MVHEFLHSLGVLDLYSKDSSKNPVGPYDVMSKVGSAPSYPLAQTRKMLGFDTIKDISGSGTKSITLYAPYSEKGDNAVMVKTPLNDNEYFVFEYRKKTKISDSNNVDSQIPYSGLVCYRVNDALSDSEKSNFNNKNYIYVFRPSDTGISDFMGDINNAPLSLSDGKRSEIGSSDENATIKDNALVYTNDVNSKIQVKVTSQGDDYITFDITIPDYSSENVWSDLTDTSSNTNYFADSDNAKSVAQIGDTLYFLNKNKVYQYKDGVYSSLGDVDSEVNNGNLVVYNNEIYVFYADYSSKKESVVLKKYESGKWIEKNRISTNGSYSNVPYAVNLNGELYCLYDLDNTNVTVMKWNGSEFLELGKITDCKYLMAPSMALYKNELYVMLSDFQSNNEGGIIYKQTNNGFEKVYNVNSSANHFQKLVVSEDNIYAFTYNTSSNKTNIAVSTDGKSWGTDQVVPFEEKVNSISFDIKDGDLYLGIVDSNGVAKMYTYKDSSWNKVGSNIYSNASSMSFVLGSDKIYAYLGDSVKYKTLVKYNKYFNKDDNTNSGNGEGGSSEGGNTTVDPPKDDTTIEKPKVVLSDVKAKGVSYNYNAVKLTWNKVSNANGYYIYRYDAKTKSYKLIKTVSSKYNYYINSSLTCNNYYYYRVIAYNNTNGLVKSKYNTVKVKPILKSTSIKVSAGKKKAYIKWNKVSGASGYQIYTKNSKGKYVLTKTTKSTSYTKTKLTPKKTYYYKVRAYKVVGGKKVYSSFSTVKKVKVK